MTDPTVIFADVVMDPVEQCLRMLEAEVDNIGWDNPPMYFWLFKSPGRADDTAAYGVVTLTNLPPVMYQDPAHGLVTLVHLLRGDPAPGEEFTEQDLAEMRHYIERILVDQMILPAFHGIGMVAEAWQTPPLSYDEVVVLRPSERPDRVEARIACVTTVDGRMLHLNRVRGEAPFLFPEGPQSPDDHTMQAGTIPDSLRQLCTLVSLLND